MRRLIVSLLIAYLGAGDYSGDALRPILHGSGTVRLSALPLDSAEPARRRIGPLELIGAWRMDSPNPAFGSWSALTVDGPWLTFLSDAGGVFRLRMDGLRPAAAAWRDLPDGPGPGAEKKFRDSEAMVRDPTSGRVWIAFEQRHSIWRLTPDLARVEAKVFPPAMQGWRNNGGAEAMVRLADGRFLVFEEGRADDQPKDGLIFAGDPVATGAPPQRFRYRPAPGFRVVDSAELPDGRLLVLERKLGLPSTSRLTMVPAGAIRPGALVSGRLVALFAPPVLADNFEAIAVAREGGRTIVWLASDDNFSRLQRSLLLKFALVEQQKPAGRAPAGLAEKP